MIVNVIEMACRHPLYYHYITVYITIITIYVCCVYHCQVTSLFFKQIYPSSEMGKCYCTTEKFKDRFRISTVCSLSVLDIHIFPW
jgi:hypothetical protein